jgi:hypothetical protein
VSRKKRQRPVSYSSAKERSNAYRRWRRRFRHLKNDIINLAFHRYIYREVRAMIEANSELQVGSAFYDWMQAVYVNDMTLAIRRLVDWDKKAIPLVQLLQEIEDHPEVITRARFVARYEGGLRDLGHGDFERFAQPGASQITPKIIRERRRELIAAQRRLRQFVNRHVAHRARHAMRRLPTFDELDACIDVLERLVKDCSLLLEQEGLAQVVPVIQYDWRAPFRVPWIAD